MPPSADEQDSDRGPLSGLLVADFTRVLAGPLATSGLADLGADVIKIEQTGLGDDTRRWGPPWSAGTSTYYACANRSKRSIELNLATAADRAMATQLVSRADVVVENFRTGVMDRWGLGPAQVAQCNPRAVYCSITGFGSGAGATIPGYDFVVQAAGGLMSITGSRDAEPTKVGVALVDVLTGKDAVIGILAALADRERHGQGQWIQISLMTSLLAALTNQSATFLATGQSPTRMGNEHPSIAPYETLSCRDGLLAIACGNDRQFVTLCQVLGRADLAADKRFATNASRVEHRRSLIAALSEAIASGTVDEWAYRLTEAGVPAAGVATIGEAVETATALGLDPVIDVDGVRQIRHPVLFSLTNLRAATPAPTLGQHNDEIRSWLRTQPDTDTYDCRESVEDVR